MKSKKSVKDKKLNTEKNLKKRNNNAEVLQEGKSSIKKITVVVPNAVDEMVDDFAQKVTSLFTHYQFDFVFVTSEKSALQSLNNVKIVKVKEDLSFNKRVVEAFNFLTGDSVIICDMTNADCEKYLQDMVSAWEKGSKIVRLQYKPNNLNFWQKIGKFFQRLHQKVLNFLISFGGLNKQLDCSNAFQLYDKTVYRLMVAIPEKNAYLRNFDELRYFPSSVTTTTEKVVVENDKPKWNKKFLTATILLSLFLISILLTIVLMPVAKQNNFALSYTAIMIFVLFGSLSIGLCFLYSALLDFKLGKN